MHIKVVGPCGSGKSTLALRLRALGYQAGSAAQDHSYVPDMWRRHNPPDLLIYLDVSLEESQRRGRTGFGWDWEYLEQQKDRLRHAREHCDLYLMTDGMDEDEVVAHAVRWIEEQTAGRGRPVALSSREEYTPPASRYQVMGRCSMPGFFDKVKSGAEKAAFEADRLRRVNQAQGVLKGYQRELDAIVAAWGPQVLALYDSGSLTQPELLAGGPQIDELRQKVAAQEAEIARIREERPPEPEIVAPPTPPSSPDQPHQMEGTVRSEPVQADVSAPRSGGRFCGACGAALPPGVKFCMECGTKVEAEG
ncbi:MAG TPA: zinc-ribbon domain-containing protein [Anaerolineae bacterium]|nr:zinc-ribbon domain-containing protein [Anaerolineae bacterium]